MSGYNTAQMLADLPTRDLNAKEAAVNGRGYLDTATSNR